MRFSVVIFFLSGFLLASCSEQTSNSQGGRENATAAAQDPTTMPENIAAAAADNPFFEPSPLPLEYPQFDLIENQHFMPAYQRGMAEQMAEVEAIAEQTAQPSFDNTIVAMELSGQLLDRVAPVFSSLAGAHTNDGIRAIQQQLAPMLAAHSDSIVLNRALFERIKALYDERDQLSLDSESERLLEQYYTDFVRAGAQLNEQQQARLREINAETASLQTRFSQNVLSEVNDLAVIVDSREELAGLDEAAIEAAAAEAQARGLSGKYVLPLLNTSDQPVLTNLRNRQLRERIYKTSLSRGSRGGDFDNTEILSAVLRLRAERAQLLGYDNHAQYTLEDQTAQTVEAVNQRLAELTPPAVANVEREAADLQQIIDAEGGDFSLQAWDWSYYAEKLRLARYEFDANQLKPYLELNNVLEKGVFYAAEQLYGINFEERHDLPVYQEDVRVFEVTDSVGTTLAIFIADFYARPSKRGGAWMNAYRSQNDLLHTQPVVANHLNITEPPEGEPTLLTFDEVTTMFHEFGHALHGMFSNVNYPYFSGTRVPRDFVEYPSQVNEMWSTWPQVLQNYAVHYETGEPMPQELLDKVLATQKFNQGFATTEYLAASLLDQAYHQLTPEQIPQADQILQFEADALAAAGVALEAVSPRYRSTYFSHILGGYSAGYYSYIWSEVLDADTVDWFKENGGLTRANGDHFRQTLLSRGGSAEAMSLFRDFRGRDPQIEPLLERRGLN